MLSDDLCACVFQGMLVEGPSGPEGPTVSLSASTFITLLSSFPLCLLITAVISSNMCW